MNQTTPMRAPNSFFSRHQVAPIARAVRLLLVLPFAVCPAVGSIWESSGWALLGDLAGSVTYDSNVFASRDGESDTIYGVNTLLKLQRKGSLSDIVIATNADFRWFSDRSDQNSVDPNLTIDYSYPNTGEAILRQRARLGWNRESYPDFSVGNRVRRTELFGNWDGVVYDTGKTLVIAQVGARDTDYTDYQSDVLDYSGGVGLAWARSPLVQYTLLVNYERSEFSGVVGSVGDSSRNGYSLNLGVRGEFTPKISGEASVGMGRNKYDGAIAGSDNSWFTAVNITWEPTERRSVSISASRGTYFDALGTAYNRLDSNISFRQGIAGGFGAALRAGFGEYDYSESGSLRKDQFFRLGAGFDYNLTGRFGAGIDFSWTDKTSDQDLYEFDKYEISGRASWRF